MFEQVRLIRIRLWCYLVAIKAWSKRLSWPISKLPGLTSRWITFNQPFKIVQSPWDSCKAHRRQTIQKQRKTSETLLKLRSSHHASASKINHESSVQTSSGLRAALKRIEVKTSPFLHGFRWLLRSRPIRYTVHRITFLPFATWMMNFELQFSYAFVWLLFNAI